MQFVCLILFDDNVSEIYNRKKINLFNDCCDVCTLIKIESNSLSINMQKHDFLGFLTLQSIYPKRIRRRRRRHFMFNQRSNISIDLTHLPMVFFDVHRIFSRRHVILFESNVTLTSLRHFQYLNTTRCIHQGSLFYSSFAYTIIPCRRRIGICDQALSFFVHLQRKRRFLLRNHSISKFFNMTENISTIADQIRRWMTQDDMYTSANCRRLVVRFFFFSLLFLRIEQAYEHVSLFILYFQAMYVRGYQTTIILMKEEYRSSIIRAKGTKNTKGNTFSR